MILSVYYNQYKKMCVSKICTILLLLCVTTSFADDDEDPIVTLPYGKIRGHVLLSENKNTYYAFQEIPYASPPVGELRFKPPIAVESWNDVLDTKKNTKICYQQYSYFPTPNVTETEDCLYLNVYTPQKPDTSEDLLPVFVWIHGGGFAYGDGTFQQIGPKFFIDSNIVIVALNYRLGPLGFLTTGDGVIPGNLGLKDQHFALKWIKENIELFGGDPDKITIAGESAGGCSVGFHLLSKQSEGLFRGAILQSGTTLSPYCYHTYSRYFAFQLGKSLNPSFSSNDSTDLLNLLQNSTAADIMYTNLVLPEDLVPPATLWAPVIEYEEQNGAFITGPMHDDIENGNFVQVPVMMGFTSEEGLIFIANNESLVKADGARYDNNLSTIVELLPMTDENKVKAGSELRKIYTDGKFQDDLQALVSFTTDYVITTPLSRHAELQSQYTDVYVYQLSYKGELGGMVVDIEGVDCSKVGHTEDLKYIWEVEGFNSDSSVYPKADILTRNRILKMWSNFVKNLNPTPEEDSLLENVIWPKVTPDNFPYLNINVTLEVKTDPKQYKKWKKVIDSYAIPPLIIY